MSKNNPHEDIVLISNLMEDNTKRLILFLKTSVEKNTSFKL